MIAVRLFWSVLVVLSLAAPSGAAQLLTRSGKENPALVLTAFGTSTKAEAAYALIDAKAREAFPGHEIRWAFTSEVIREKMNARYEKEGNPKRLKSLLQALADLQAEGYRKVAVQPLHIFPGEEYAEVLAQAADFYGLRVEVGEPLFHRWERMEEVLAALEAEVLPPSEGFTVFAAHGTPTTDSGANTALLGLERLVKRRFPAAALACVDGVLSSDEALAAAARHPGKRVRLVSLMYVSGDHVMNDLMGTTDSWKAKLEAAGKSVDAPLLAQEGVYKGLAHLPRVNELFLMEVKRTLDRL